MAIISCSNDEELPELLEMTDESNTDNQSSDDSDSADSTDDDNPTNDCPTTSGFVFEEANGIIAIEFEDNTFSEDWVLKNNQEDTSGNGFMQWEGSPKMNDPGNGMVVFPIRINQPGTYRFIWNSSFRKGDNGTEHNDSWLRFPDADDFFGRKDDGSVVYPNGSGKSPNPNGSSSDGWFKIYRSGNDAAFKWEAFTSDHDGHLVYATFENAGVYNIEISARSDFHGIDKLLLFEESMSMNAAIDAGATLSVKTTCD
ncbi:MAG: hypothetical protein AAGF77_11135 [Bacteroidota bacterium]